MYADTLHPPVFLSKKGFASRSYKVLRIPRLDNRTAVSSKAGKEKEIKRLGAEDERKEKQGGENKREWGAKATKRREVGV